MLHKLTICNGSSSWLLGNTSPNPGITHRSDVSVGNRRIPSFDGQDDCQLKSPPVVIARLADLQPPGSRAILSVGVVQMQAELIGINQQTPRDPVNTNRPRHCPKQPPTSQVPLGKRLIGHSRGDLHRVPQPPQRSTDVTLHKNFAIFRLIRNKSNALKIICLRPNQFEYDEQQEVFPRQLRDCLIPRHPLRIYILHPSVDTGLHSLGDGVPRPIRIDDHLAEGDVISSRAAMSRVREKTSIPQYPINPRDTIFTTPFSNGIFPL